VIVKNKRIVATGYNGAPAGRPGCLTHGACSRGQKSYEEQPSLAGDYSDCIAVHAEANALLYADRDRCEGATIYITGEPCSWCDKLIQGAGIARIVY
jgi:deoxycytidylate deaminase